jgi:hypothetical protein
MYEDIMNYIVEGVLMSLVPGYINFTIIIFSSTRGYSYFGSAIMIRLLLSLRSPNNRGLSFLLNFWRAVVTLLPISTKDYLSTPWKILTSDTSE